MVSMTSEPGEPTNGNRITTRQFYEALLQIKGEMGDMERRITNKIDCIPAHQAQIDALDYDVKELRKKSNLWDGINSIGLVLGAIIAATIKRT